MPLIKYKILITGAHSGFGFFLSKKFEQKGHEILRHNGKVHYDLRDQNQLKKLAKEAIDFGVDVLINNAGIICPSIQFQDYDLPLINDMVDVNLKAPIVLSWMLRENLKTIININSMVGMEIKKNRTLYSSTKWGLRGFSNSLKLETKIRCLDIYPTNIKLKPDQTNAMEVDEVTTKIYKAFCNKKINELIIDGRNK
mgnify:CR=1 FL=1